MDNFPTVLAENINWINKNTTIAFLSVAAGDGTTTACVAIAESLKKSNAETILLVDFNYTHPEIHSIFNKPITPGLTDAFFAFPKNIKDIIQKTDSGIDIVSIGQNKPNFIKNMQANILSKIMDDMRSYYDIIIFDMCPLNQLEISKDFLRLFDGIVLILSCNSTKWEIAQHAKVKLESAGANILGTILNNREYYIPSWLYDLV